MLLTDCNNDYASWIDKKFGTMKIYDAGDCAPTPFDLITAVGQIYVYTKVLWNTSKKVVAIGGDHTLSWSFLRGFAKCVLDLFQYSSSGPLSALVSRSSLPLAIHPPRSHSLVKAHRL